MDKILQCCVFFVLFVVVDVQAIRCSHKLLACNLKLFVFGDSYADTGNTPKGLSISWNLPYGITYPGMPSGRFSNGRILTDYVAEYFGMPTPVDYAEGYFQSSQIGCGMNFAFGGTGVFDTAVPGPNLATQISFLEALVRQGVYTQTDLRNSIALVSVAGNDYSLPLLTGKIQNLQDFITRLINQLALDLQGILKLGVRKIGVIGIEPLGCLPQATGPFFLTCNEIINMASRIHNQLLEEAVQYLRNENEGSVLVILDLYSAFMTALEQTGSTLRPCCLGAGEGIFCSITTVCFDPNSAFFWDNLHPAQHGWYAVTSALQPSLRQLYYGNATTDHDRHGWAAVSSALQPSLSQLYYANATDQIENLSP